VLHTWLASSSFRPSAGEEVVMTVKSRELGAYCASAVPATPCQARPGPGAWTNMYMLYQLQCVIDLQRYTRTFYYYSVPSP
jgi:hypothetical protein